jgi:hypothetical protein
MSGGSCTAWRRGHQKGSKRGRDCPATVHGPIGTASASSGSSAGTTSSTNGAASTASTGRIATPTNLTTTAAPASGLERAIEEWGTTLLELALTEDDERAREIGLTLMAKAASESGDAGVDKSELCDLFTDHLFCLLFEDIAVALKGLTDAVPGLVNELVDESALPPLIKAVVKVLLSRAASIAMKGVTAPVEILRIKACALAIAFCPDVNNHPSHKGNLNENCAEPFAAAVTEQAAAVK